MASPARRPARPLTVSSRRAVTFRPDWKAIESEVRGLAVRSAVFIGEGWTSTAYRVNDEVVFKFPKRLAEWEELDREIAFLAYARPFLTLPVVEHLYQTPTSAGAPFGYAVYRYLPGQPVNPEGLSGRARSALAADLAGFLRVLHDIRPSPELERALPREDAHAVSVQYQRVADERVGPGLSTAERQSLAESFGSYLEDRVNLATPARILHADLSAQHVLHADGSVTGILDWGDVCFGDPDYDFSYLYLDFGEAFVREVARRYGHPDPDRMVRKARYFSVVDQIGTIVYGGDRGLPGDDVAAWRRLRALLRRSSTARLPRQPLSR
jgi:aminoglycoside 2''-phosphotransferase